MNDANPRPIDGRLPRVAAIAVLYHPKMESLQRLIGSTVGQAEAIYVIDNTPDPAAVVRSFLAAEASVRYIPLGQNVGIAAAQNAGIRASMEAGFTHVLLLDQDSALPAGMVRNLLAAEAAILQSGPEVAAVGPQFIDEKTGRPCPAIRHRWIGIQKLRMDPRSSEPVETDHMIASGSLMRISVLSKVGLMRDDFFIDWVDIEWGMRARNMGYKSYYVPNVVMRHSVGDAVVVLFGRDVHLHNNIRNYYMLRNAIYLFRLKSMGWKWKINFLPRIPCYLILYPLLAKHRAANLRCVLRGFADGLAGRMGEMRKGAASRV
ncbi:MAG: glycosyltransferase family 2 protein [Acidobacteriaceae bacterium]